MLGSHCGGSGWIQLYHSSQTNCYGIFVRQIPLPFSRLYVHYLPLIFYPFLINVSRVGLFVGLVLSSTFLSIIEGSVNAILVSYASAPVDFHANHPSLSDELKSVWKEFWLPRG